MVALSTEKECLFWGKIAAPKINGDSMKADQLMSGLRMNKGVEARRQASMIKDYCGASGEKW